MSLHPKRWQLAPPAPPSHIARFPHLHPVVVQVLYNRGLIDPAEVEDFLSNGDSEANPFTLQGMTEAVTRLRRALRAGEPIAVYGDFDADGVTATVLLVQTLRALGGQAYPYIPDRAQGYGLHEETLTQLARRGARVVVTVDCGIRALEKVAHASRLGLDVIVTDHHSVGDTLPQAAAVIDPKQEDRDCPFYDLAGVGVAYRLAQALLRSHRQTPVTTQEVRLEEEDLVDLVALGTVADLVPLMGENRALVRRGLVRINRMERPGIEALCQQTGLHAGQIDTSAIGYALGPRINAAGRLAHAKTAYRLLQTQYPAEAKQLAEELDRLNHERRELTGDMLERARQMALSNDGDVPLIFAAAPDFRAGIVGLVASRLVDEFYRPSIVVEIDEETSRGSARSIPEFHITEALDKCTDLLVRHGGHAGAAGFTVRNDHLEELAARLRTLASDQLSGIELTPVLSVDSEISMDEMTWEFQHELSQLEPYGYANRQPLFLSKNVRVDHPRTVGSAGRHLKLGLSNGWNTWDAIAFRQGEWLGKLSDRVDVVYHLEINEWNGHRRLQLNVQDIRPAGLDDAVARLWDGPDEQESTED